MPEVPKSAQIGKCERCGTFRRLANLSAGVCLDTSACAKAEFEPVIEPEHTASEAVQMVPCDTCNEWLPENELQGGTCRECDDGA